MFLISTLVCAEVRERKSDWFSSLFEFSEANYETTKSNFILESQNQILTLRGRNSRKSYLVGNFRTPSLAELREQVKKREADNSIQRAERSLTIEFAYGDVSILHAEDSYSHATFQAASQFNCLEFISPTVTPEHGITGYEYDKTQGPACSIACGAGTAYRNYFHKWKREDGVEQEGQTKEHMINNLRDLEKLLSPKLDTCKYFEVRGGYTFSSEQDLAELNQVPLHFPV